jgi:Rab-GTPase-TBC domain
MVMDVLMCYAEIDQEVGYVQGMNSIAAAIAYNFWIVKQEHDKLDDLDNFEEFDAEANDEELSRNQRIKRDIFLIRKLSIFDLKFSTEEVFYVFCSLMKFSKLRECFGVGLELLQERIKNFEINLKEELPKVHNKMCGSGVSEKLTLYFDLKLDSSTGLLSAILPDYILTCDSNQTQWKATGYIFVSRV